MKALFGWIRVIFTPRCWVVLGAYSKQWDARLNNLMVEHRFTNLTEYHVQLGPVTVWVRNHPYASFRLYKYDNAVLLGTQPKRITMLRAMDKMRADTMIELER